MRRLIIYTSFLINDSYEYAFDGHTYLQTVKLPMSVEGIGCTTAGKTVGSCCSVCKVVLKEQTELPAKGHSWDAENRSDSGYH